MSIGSNIASLRAEKNLSQRQLAALVSATGSMIAQIERDTKAPSLPLGKAIADALDVGVEELFDKTEGDYNDL